MFVKPVLRTLLAASLISFILAAPTLRAQEYVGVLPEMLKPEVSEKLGLSEEQREQIQQLIRTRMSAAIGLSQTLREAPVSQHEQLREEFNRESEKLAFELLSPEQQVKLAKHRVQWMGMLSLGDPKVAEALNLADWQQTAVEEWTDRVQANRRGPAAARVRSEAEQAIRQQISDSQWSAWQVLAGQIESTASGPPVPPEPPAPAAEQVASQPPQAESSPSDSPADNASLPVEEVRLEMNFQGQPWGEVVNWLASQADLSLQSDVMPPGTFSYRDRSRKYSVTEAMDVMNASLLNLGYTLLRQGRMLRVIDFEEDQKMRAELIGELADYVDAAELARRGTYEPVKHIFTLERLNPDEIKPEVEQLLSIQGSIVSLPSSGQIIVTDMAGNVRAIGEMVKRAEDPTSSRASSIQTFPLKSINAEEVLMVARPLLGLEEGVNTSEEISISVNTFGTTIYAKGSPDKVQNLKDLISQMDVPPDAEESTVGKIETPEIRRHKVVGTDLQLAYEIVSQLLAGSPDVRLAQDAVAKQLVLQARPSEHEMVDQTLKDLAGETSDFQVVQLTRLDPTLVIAAVKKFFGLTDTADATSGAPVIDGDLLARQVWVKGSATQVTQITEFIEKLEQNASSNDILGDTIRMVPLTGSSARQTLTQVEQLWRARHGDAHPIRVITPGGGRGDGPALREKTFAPPPTPRETIRSAESGPAKESTSEKSESTESEAAKSGTLRPQARRESVPSGRLTLFPQQQKSASDRSSEDSQIDAPNAQKEAGEASADQTSDAGEIVIMEGPGGLIITSEDKEALAQFDNLLRLLADQAALGGTEPTVVYLRNIKASAAKELLETIMSGSAGSASGGGGLLGDMAGAVLGGFGGGMFGGMLGGSGDLASSSGLASGDYSITADPRLNALIIKASPADMSLIEQLLTVIDQVESPFSIETQGHLAMIPVISQDVTQVLNTIKSLYGERIEGASSASRGGGGGGGGGQPNPADIINALRGAAGGGRGGRGGASSELAEPKIAISADTNTNMLIVMAQPNQIAEIEQLVRLIDQAGAAEEEGFGYSSLDGIVSASVFQDSIGRILGPKAQTNTSSSSTPSSSTASTPSSSGGGEGGGGGDDAAAQARRAAFFEMLRQRSGGGGGPGGDASGGRGGDGGGGGFRGFGGGAPGGFGGGAPGGFGGGGGRGGDNGGGRGGR